MKDERQKLEQAIEAQETLRGTIDDDLIEAAIAALREQLSGLETPEQQRKLVSILFMDIVASTEIVKHLDPEDALEIMDNTLKRLAVPVEEHGGHVTRFMGDGFKAVFGAPVAQENDPDMAIRAGLGILETSRELASELQSDWSIPDFQVRVGINTGLVALGGMTEAEFTMMGGTVNLAARLESAAPPGGLLISHETYRHVRGVFDVEPLEPIKAKGFDQPVPVYLVQRTKPRAFRLRTRGVEGVETSMVGREMELKSLQEALYAAIEDLEGSTVTVIGEAGVGKSRLVYEFQNWLDLLPHEIRFFQGRGRQETQHQPYSLLRDLFSFRFEIQENDSADLVQQKIEAGLIEVFQLDEAGRMRVHMIGQLLGFEFKDSSHLHAVTEDPQQLRDLTTAYLGEYFQGISEISPIVIVLEDIHWADDSSLDMINRLGHKVSEQRSIIVCLARQRLFERRPYWGEGLAHHQRVELKPLSKRESRELVGDILQNVDQVPTSLAELVVTGAEGNPFYIEELVKMLVEDGVIVTGPDRWRIDPKRLAEVEVPSTLTGVLQARLDSLPAIERETLQQASIVGRVFWDDTVQYVGAGSKSGERHGDTRQTVEQLTSLRARELVFHREESVFSDSGEYIFKHAVLRDVTYESVLKHLRRTYHGLVAEWLIQKSKGRESEYAGLIADHLELAEKLEQATIYLYQAGEGAAHRFANTEALEYFRRALSLTPEDDLVARYDLLLARESVLNLIGDREVQKGDLAALEKITESLDDVKRQAEVALRRMIYLVETSSYGEAADNVADAIDLAQVAGDVRCEARLNLHWGRSLWHQGKSKLAIAPLEAALLLAQIHHFPQLEAEVLRNLGVVYRNLGDSARFLSLTEQALIKYRESGNIIAEAAAINNLGVYHHDEEFDSGKATDYFEQSCVIARQIGDRVMEGTAIFNLGNVAGDIHKFDLAIEQCEQAIGIAREVRDGLGLGSSMARLGRCYTSLSEFDKAKVIFEEIVQYSKQTGLMVGEALMAMILMNFYCTLGDYTRAESFHHQFYDLWGEREYGFVETRASIFSSWLRHQMGDQQTALKYSQQAIDNMRNNPKHNLRPDGLIIHGHALAALGDFQEAETAYQNAVTSAYETHRPRHAMEALAGLAWAAMASQEFEAALNHIEKILSFMEDEKPALGHPLDGTMEPFRIYLTCYQVLKATQDPRAPTILADAFNLLQKHATNISDDELKYCFLDNVAANREIVREYESSGLGEMQL